MSEEKVIQISGTGGKGGNGPTPVEAHDTLKSVAIARGIDLICEGPVGGLVDGERSLYLNDTPLIDKFGRRNFQSVEVVFDRLGTQDQSHIPGFPSIEASVSVNSGEILKNTPHIRTITNSQIDTAEINMAFPALYSIDPSNGNTNGASVQFKIEVKPSGGSFLPVLAGLINYNMVSQGNGIYRSSNDQYGIIAYLNMKDLYSPEEYVEVLVEYRLVGAVPWTLWRRSKYYASTMQLFESYDVDGNFIKSYGADREIRVINLPTGQYEVKITNESSYGVLTVKSVCTISSSPIITVIGKASSKYERTYPIMLADYGAAPWEIRVTRITPDSNSQYLQNKIQWDSYTEIQDEKLTYPNSFVVAWKISSQQFTSIPKRGYDCYLKIIQVPTNYNPDTRQYTGNWDGTFKAAWSDNPAWCFYDLLTNTRYGLGKLIDPVLIDKWSLYAIGQYCDELVPSGYKNGLGNDIWEPRFTLNVFIQTRAEAYRVLNDLAAVFRGAAYWAAGTITAIQDAPADPTMLFTPANVIDGLFNYQGSSKRARHTAALVRWNDPTNMYKQIVEYVEDADGILRYGYNPVELSAFGCTSRGQARRVGKWILYTEQNEKEVVTFGVGLDSVYVRPGNVINVADPGKAGVRFGGRVASATTTQVTVDAAVTLEVGETYQIICIMPNGTLETKSITNSPGTYTVLNVNSAFSSAPQQNSIWMMPASNVVPLTYRVLTITEKEKNQFVIMAVAHDPNKYAAIELGLEFEAPPITVRPPLSEVLPPINLLLAQSSYATGPNIYSYRLSISWEKSPSTYVVKYICEYRAINSNWISFTGDEYTFHRDIDNLAAGDYEVRVRAVNAAGIHSENLSGTITLVNMMNVPPNVGGLALQTAWTGMDCRIKWNSILDSTYTSSVHRRYKIEVYKSGPVLIRTEYVDGDNTEYNYTYGKNYDDNSGSPVADITFKVWGENWNNVVSVTEATINAINSAPATPSVTSQYLDRDCVLNWTPVTDADFNETWVRIYAEQGRTTLRRTVHLSGNTYTYPIAENEIDYPGHANPWYVYFRITHFDKFGQSSSFDLDIRNDAPAVPSNVSVRPGFQQALIEWLPPDTTDWDVVEVWRSDFVNNRADASFHKVFSGRSIMCIDSGLVSLQHYYYWLRSVDTSGNASGWYPTSPTGGLDVVPYRLDGSSDIIPGSLPPPDPGELNLETIDIVAVLPTLPNANYPPLSMVLLTTDHKLYRNRDEVWTAEVDGADIAADTISGNKIIAGEISAAHIASTVITAQHLNLQDTHNMIRNSEVRDGLSDGWRLNTGTSIVPYTDPSVPANCPTGHCIKIAGASGNRMADQWEDGKSDRVWIPVEPDEEFYLFARVATDSAFNPGGRIGITAIFANTPRTEFEWAGIQLYGTNEPWQRLEGRIAVPTGKNYVAFYCETYNGLFGYAFITDCRVRRAGTASLMVDGFLKANHILTDTAVITGTAQIADAVIVSAHIDELTADVLTGGTINATIGIGAGNVIIEANQNRVRVHDAQASPVTRVELGQIGVGNSDYGLKLYDENGQPTFEASKTLKSRFMQMDGIKMIKVEGPFWPMNDFGNYLWSTASSDGICVMGYEYSTGNVVACLVGLDGKKEGTYLNFGPQSNWPYAQSCCSFYDLSTSRILTMFVVTGSPITGIRWWVWDWTANNYRVAPTTIDISPNSAPEFFVFGPFMNTADYGVNNVQIAFSTINTGTICSVVVNWNTGTLVRGFVNSGFMAGTNGPHGGGQIGPYSGGDTGMLILRLVGNLVSLITLNNDGTYDSNNTNQYSIPSNLNDGWVPRSYQIINSQGYPGRTSRTSRNSRWIITSPWDRELILFAEEAADLNYIELYALIRDWGGPFGGDQPMLHRNQVGREAYPLLMRYPHGTAVNINNLALAFVYVDDITTSFKGVRHLSNILTNLTA